MATVTYRTDAGVKRRAVPEATRTPARVKLILGDRRSVEDAVRQLSDADALYVAQHGANGGVRAIAENSLARRRQERAGKAQAAAAVKSDKDALEVYRRAVRRDLKAAKKAGATAEVTRLRAAAKLIREHGKAKPSRNITEVRPRTEAKAKASRTTMSMPSLTTALGDVLGTQDEGHVVLTVAGPVRYGAVSLTTVTGDLLAVSTSVAQYFTDPVVAGSPLPVTGNQQSAI